MGTKNNWYYTFFRYPESMRPQPEGYIIVLAESEMENETTNRIDWYLGRFIKRIIVNGAINNYKVIALFND